MITTITLNEVATYHTPTTLNTDKKINLIYGLNGTGKSTLSQFLKNPNDIRFSKCQLHKPSDTKILVYNQKFIDENFYQSNEIKGVFSLSEENKEIENRIDAENKKFNEKAEEIRQDDDKIKQQKEYISRKNQQTIEKTWKIKRQFVDDDKTLAEFLSGKRSTKQELYNFLHDWQLPSSEPQKTIQKIKSEYISLKSPKSQYCKEIQKVSFDTSLIEKNPIFSQPIIGSNDNTVSKLINNLQNSDWVRQGLSYIEENSHETQQCPFCQAETITPSLAQEIKEYFDKTYEDSIKELQQLQELYSSKVTQLEAFESIEIPELVESEKQSIVALYQALKSESKNNQSLISEKIKSPSETKTLNETGKLVSELNKKIGEANNKIYKHNSKINNIDEEIRKLRDEFWDNLRWHYSETISDLDTELDKHEQKQKELNDAKLEKHQEKTTIQKALENLQSKTVNIEKAISAINNNLKSIGITDFYIKKHSDILYKIERNNQKKADITTLSEGEKTIITFLYFIELCKGKASPNEVENKKVVVIDDPVSSLSHIYVFNIGELIKSELFKNDAFEQIFVMTHSLYFFYELTELNEDRRNESQKLHRVSKNTAGSSILEMKYEEIQNDYQTYWSIINDQDQNEALIANCMRNIVEYFFNFVEKLNLSDVFDKKPLKDPRFQAFKRYINRESHSVGQNIFDLKEFNYQDFRDGLRLVFEESGYGAHYKKMAKKIPA